MRHIMCVIALGLACSIAIPAAEQGSQSGEQLIGTWSGTFDGDSAGRFTMSFARDTAEKLTGTLEVTFDAGEGYSASFRTIAVDRATVSLVYAAPGDGGDVQLDGTLDSTTLKGTWKAMDPSTQATGASGSFTSVKD